MRIKDQPKRIERLGGAKIRGLLIEDNIDERKGINQVCSLK